MSLPEPTIAPQAKALLVDPSTMTVVWANEAAQASVVSQGGDPSAISAVHVAAMAGSGDVSDAMRAVAESGETRLLNARLVSTGQGTLTIATAIYPLPGGMLLVLSDEAWAAGRSRSDPEGGRRTARRRG